MGAVILTKDKDFGDLVFVWDMRMPGVVLLRLAGLVPQRIADRVADIVQRYSVGLFGRFTVMMPTAERSGPLP